MRVSVIMPAYNGERFIAESIRSVLGQSFRDLELVVVDDGSTDGTREVVHALQAVDDRVVYLFQPNGQAGEGAKPRDPPRAGGAGSTIRTTLRATPARATVAW